MKPDYDRAAIRAAETLIKYGIKTAPISPLPILEQMQDVIVMSFADISDSSGITHRDVVNLFGKSKDAVSCIHTESGSAKYVVAYNSILPFTMIQRALAREMGHIILQHEESSPENTEEALTFARHLLCPRPLIHTIRATGLRLTEDMLSNLTGTFCQAIREIRRTPGTTVPAKLNRFISRQFNPFILSFFEYYRSVLPPDGSATADLGTYMDGYEE